MKNILPSVLVIFVLSAPAIAQQPPAQVEWLKNVLGPDAPQRKLRQIELQQMRAEVNRKDQDEWARITTKEAWEKYVAAKIALLRRSLGGVSAEPAKPRTLTTRTIDGDGCRIENLVYESRPGLVVTANLYVPAKIKAPMPGILIIPSHHNPKTQSELQDMGMTWARAGCLVLVPDMLGHGERRQHPFPNDKSYPTPFKVGRQDYYFRYNVAAQLDLAGESLMGWMIGDLMRGIDVLLSRPGIDKDKIIVLGSVAAGGDAAAVLAALDRRVAAVAPFNFGGPQPETKFPLPDNAEVAFNYMGGGSWESTRNLRLSGCDGFLPWAIVAAAAPRGLIYAHEFAWDAARDPAWKRLQKIFGFYDAADQLASVHGRGSVQGKPPEATHCNNIGPEHRKEIHPALAKWFNIDAKEYQKRLPSDELQCLTAEAKEMFKPRSVYALAGDLADQRLAAARAARAKLPADQRRGELRKQWAALLGVEMLEKGKVETIADGPLNGYRCKSLLIRHPNHPSIAVPAELLLPTKPMAGNPVVVAVSNEGKLGIAKHRADVIARLLNAGVAVCMPDLRGTGEMRITGTSRGRTSSDTAISATEWMHGRTVLGTQVQELLLVVEALRGEGIGSAGLWGESFAPINTTDAKIAVPYDADGGQPLVGEPMAGLVTLLTGLFAPEGTVRAIHIHGGLASYRSLLTDAFFYVPHDALVPGVLAVSDIDDLAAAWAPRPLSIEAAIDGHNQLIAGKALFAAFAQTCTVYRGEAVRENVWTPAALAAWLVRAQRDKE